jgi:hypothetical protein
MTRLARVWTLACIAYGLAAAVHAETADKAAKIEEIVALSRPTGFPHLLGQALPMTLHYAVREEVMTAGRTHSMGRDWNPRSVWFQRAAVVTDRAAAELAQRAAEAGMDWEPQLRAALDQIESAQLDGLLQVYRSPAAPVLMELADVGTGLFVLASLETQRKSLGLRRTVTPVMQGLSDRILALSTQLNAEQREAISFHAPRQALKTMAVVHEQFFRNCMQRLKPELAATREQVRKELDALLQSVDPLETVPENQGCHRPADCADGRALGCSPCP